MAGEKLIYLMREQGRGPQLPIIEFGTVLSIEPLKVKVESMDIVLSKSFLILDYEYSKAIQIGDRVGIACVSSKKYYLIGKVVM